jgi:hypothetical protein
LGLGGETTQPCSGLSQAFRRAASSRSYTHLRSFNAAHVTVANPFPAMPIAGLQLVTARVSKRPPKAMVSVTIAAMHQPRLRLSTHILQYSADSSESERRRERANRHTAPLPLHHTAAAHPPSSALRICRQRLHDWRLR